MPECFFTVTKICSRKFFNIGQNLGENLVEHYYIVHFLDKLYVEQKLDIQVVMLYRVFSQIAICSILEKFPT